MSVIVLILVYVIGVNVFAQTILLTIWACVISVTAVVLIVLPKIFHRHLTRKEIIMESHSSGSSAGSVGKALPRVDFGRNVEIPIIPAGRKGQGRSTTYPHKEARNSHSFLVDAGRQTDVETTRHESRDVVRFGGAKSAGDSQSKDSGSNQDGSISRSIVSASKCVV